MVLRIRTFGTAGLSGSPRGNTRATRPLSYVGNVSAWLQMYCSFPFYRRQSVDDTVLRLSDDSVTVRYVSVSPVLSSAYDGGCLSPSQLLVRRNVCISMLPCPHFIARLPTSSIPQQLHHDYVSLPISLVTQTSSIAISNP